MKTAFVDQLRKAAEDCCQSEDDQQATTSTQEFLQVFGAALAVESPRKSEPDWQTSCEMLLQEAKVLLDPCTSNGKILLERLGWELPEVLVPYVNVSEECQNLAATLLVHIAETCDPRETFTTFMEAISTNATVDGLDCCLPLIHGIIIVFSRLRRRFSEFIRGALPTLLDVARVAVESCTVPKYENHVAINDREQIIPSYILQTQILNGLVSCCDILKDKIECEQQVEKQKQLLQQYLGRYLLQLLAIAGILMEKQTCYRLHYLIHLLDCCALSLHKLLISDLHELFGEQNDDDYKVLGERTQLELERGAALAVYWRLHSHEFDQAAAEPLESSKCKPELSRSELLCALSRARSLLTTSPNRSWELVEKGVVLIDSILESATSTLHCDEEVILQDAAIMAISYMPLLQSVQEVVVHTPSTHLRKHGFSTLKNILAQAVPEKAKFECFSALIRGSTHPSMASLLLTCLKDEVAKAWPQKESEESQDCSATVKPESSSGVQVKRQHVKEPSTAFASILDLLESVFKPAGGAPQLPDQLDAVLGALNLYRFLLIREMTGGTNYSKVLSKNQLVEARKEWLLPLREYLHNLQLRIDESNDDVYIDLRLAISMTESVLYRCIELVEEILLK
ncbi:hypothetical protein O6H91_20G003400 [Diphasiastrum complanatum]|uniref:Uncharacterized protein n=1 Tax=Diphasiastrum complanatum TaxID=34168 RepID=A0ACC2AM95_DIPCM|nr:hypothetical protein O6H91_20G003400 [Diphasiastrum complanatum]